MKRFFYLDDSGKRKGPYTIEQLKEHYLFENTLVWTDGLEKWTAAGRVYLLQDIIHKPPPPLDLVDTGEIESVTIGTQVWMKRNLDVSHFRNGDPIPEARTAEEWEKAGQKKISACCFYKSDPEMGQNYGKLYNWFAVNDPRGLAPEGWHVPSDDEWSQLVAYIEAQGYPNNDAYGPKGAGNALKSCRQINAPQGSGCKTSAHPGWEWNEKYPGFDEFGFSALPGGERSTSGNFYRIGNYGYWWGSTEHSSKGASRRSMCYYFGFVGRSNLSKADGFSVRCLRD